MADITDWSCTCGAMRARIEMGEGTRLICYCTDCQAFARYAGRPEWLDEAGGSDLYQTTPDNVEITQGTEHLACVRLTNKGPLRWSASCCGTPFANTLTTMQVPFASMQVRGMGDPDLAGEVRLRANRASATGQVKGKPGSLGAMVRGFMVRAAQKRLAGRHRDTPFFDMNGKPVVPVTKPDKAALDAAYTPARG